MPTPIKSSSNLHTVYMWTHGLGVECTACGHRAIAFAGRTDDFKGDMKELSDLRFKCSACGSRDWKGWLFATVMERDAWLEGLTVSPMGGGGPSF